MKLERLLLIGLAGQLASCQPDPFAVTPATGLVTGLVVDMDGEPLSGAEISVLEGSRWSDPVYSDAWGSFETEQVQGNRWVRARADGYFHRIRPAMPSRELVLRLDEDDGATVRLRFAGSTSFGQGYYDEGVIHEGLEGANIPAALTGVGLLLDDPQLTSVALEAPMSLDAAQHPDKTSLETTHPAAALSLALTGVDVVDLATDHAYDQLDQGLTDTIAALEAAGLAWFGAGSTEEEAWGPIYRDVGALRLGLLACSTIQGSDEPGSLANDEHAQGGAAPCTDDWIDDMADEVVDQADFVVLQIHGGQQLDPNPSQAVVETTERARQAGVDLVINHHPLVNGGVETLEGMPALWSLGALASDLALATTFPSALLEVHVHHDGSLERAFLEPVLRDGLRPMAVVGWPQQRIARDILALSDSSVALDNGAVEIDLDGRSQLEERQLGFTNDVGTWSHPISLDEGWLASVQGAEDWRVGTDLLRVGDFEDIDVDGQTAEGSLWVADSSYEWFSDQAASSGSYGLRLSRDASQTEPVWSNPAHRMTLDGATSVTVAGQLRTAGIVELQVSWYEDTSGSSFERSYHLFATGDDWVPFAIDLQPPDGAVALNVYVKLFPPSRGRVWADLDELRIVAWEDGQPADAMAYDSLRVQGAATVTVRRRAMPVSRP